MQHQVFRDKNKGIVKSWLRRAKAAIRGKEEIFSNGFIPVDALRAMYLLARMRGLADEIDVGFAAYFVTKDGKYFLTTNLKEENDD